MVSIELYLFIYNDTYKIWKVLLLLSQCFALLETKSLTKKKNHPYLFTLGITIWIELPQKEGHWIYFFPGNALIRGKILPSLLCRQLMN